MVTSVPESRGCATIGGCAHQPLTRGVSGELRGMLSGRAVPVATNKRDRSDAHRAFTGARFLSASHDDRDARLPIRARVLAPRALGHQSDRVLVTRSGWRDAASACSTPYRPLNRLVVGPGSNTLSPLLMAVPWCQRDSGLRIADPLRRWRRKLRDLFKLLSHRLFPMSQSRGP